jgi:histidine ammonia-lyase
MELRQCEEILNCEINNSNDNPLLLPEEEMVISCGNFHALHPG